ncbi:MAG: hypothetical protein FJ399_13035, partial [Verrucomicrobia bacterium]|nr:hypothetical protein [Verrucomicrobiota bacterium]
FKVRFDATSPDTRGTFLQNFIRDESARVMRVAPDRLAAARPLGALGLDSLMAIELRNRFRLVAGADVAVAAILDGASVATLAAELGRHLASGKTGTLPAVEVGADPSGGLTPERAADALARLDHLSDEEVEALLGAGGARRDGR